MAIKYIFFDFDGVLAESVNVKTEAFRQMYLPYGVDFANRVVDYHLANGGVSRFEKIKIWNGQWLNEPVSEERISNLAKEFSDLAIDGVVHAPEVHGTSAFLQGDGKAYIKYIITGTPTEEIIPILERRQMAHFFEAAFGSPEKKGYWVNRILTENNINPSECIFVGDALADYNAALENNIIFILRETAEAKDLFSSYNGYRIADISGLQDVIKAIDSSDIA